MPPRAVLVGPVVLVVVGFCGLRGLVLSLLAEAVGLLGCFPALAMDGPFARPDGPRPVLGPAGPGPVLPEGCPGGPVVGGLFLPGEPPVCC